MTLLGLGIRNVKRNGTRTALTIVGVAVTILTFMLIRTVIWAWASAESYAVKDRVVTRHKVTFVMSLPRRYVDDIQNAPALAGHVKDVTFANWFGGRDPAHESEFFATLAVDAPTYFKVYNEVVVPPAELEAFLQDRKGAVVGDVLAKKMGWQVGQKVSLESGIYPENPSWEFHIVGIYTASQKSVDRSTFLFHANYLNDALAGGRKDMVGWIVTRTDSAANAAAYGMAIDKIFDDRDTQTLSQDEATFQKSFLAGVSAVFKALDLVSFVILLILLLILGNTIAMGVRERTNEYGVLRALGFLPKHIVLFIVGESTFIGLAGGVLGLLLSYPLIEKGIGRFLEENMGAWFPYFRIPPVMALVALLLSGLLGAAAAVIPAFLAQNLKITDALRRVA